MAHSDDDATFYDILNDNDGNLIGIGGTQGDPRMESIDKLMEIGIGEYLSLPQLVVVGDQSSGKSSVLEGLTGLPFPRDSKLCTRFATQIVFRRSTTEGVSISIIPSTNCPVSEAEKLRGFNAHTFDNFTEKEFAKILVDASRAMKLPQPGQPNNSGKSAFSEHIFKVELRGPNHRHLSVIDIPGLFRVPTEGVTTQEDKTVVRSMVMRFITNPRSIIMAVIPANVDIATQEIINIAKEKDPTGERTLGVITKPDLVDKGTESNVADLVLGKSQNLRLGYCVVRNRGQQQLGLTLRERHRKEQEFFQTPPFDVLPKDRVGVPALYLILQDILHAVTQRDYPKVKAELRSRLSETEHQLAIMGRSRATEAEQRGFLLDLAAQFQALARAAVTVDYGSSHVFDDREMRVATEVVHCNTSLNLMIMQPSWRNAMKKGSDKGLNACKTNGVEETAHDQAQASTDTKSVDPTAAGEEDSKKVSQPDGSDVPVDDTGPQINGTSKPSKRSSKSSSIKDPWGLLGYDNETMQLDGVLPLPPLHTDPADLGTTSWVARTYQASRGFDLGTFSPAILRNLFSELSANWEGFVYGYVSRIIVIIHRFIARILSAVCPDQVIRQRIWTTLSEPLNDRYRLAVEHVQMLLNAERHGNMITVNSVFDETVTGLRKEKFSGGGDQGRPAEERFMKALSQIRAGVAGIALATAPVSESTKRKYEFDTYTRFLISDIHDILQSYFDVASRRFVDSVCLQVTDHMLISGPNSPLLVFSPIWVGYLTQVQLSGLAAESESKLRSRRELNMRLEKLKEGRRALF